MVPLDSIVPDWVMNNFVAFDDSAAAILLPGCSSSSPSFLGAELERQSQEIDWLLLMENQRLRLMMQEKWRQNAALLLKYESKIMEFVTQKDRDLELARSRTMELQSFVMKAQEDNEALKNKAMETEAMVLDLSSKLEEAKAVGNPNPNPNGGVFSDVGSCCESSSSSPNREVKVGNSCRGCGNSRLEVVFLPCHHLCCCTACEPLLGLCPVCQTVKGASLEVIFD